jgi:hypothetical protein
VADAENPDGDKKLVLLRIQHEGAPRECIHPSPVLRPHEYYFRGVSAISGTYAQPSVLADLNADARAYLESQDASLTMYNIQLGYDYWSAGTLDASPRECFS